MAQLVSAFPALYEARVVLAVLMVMLVMTINLRGVKEAGVAFAIPTYFFLAMMCLTLGVGFYRLINGTLGTVIDPPELETAATGVVTLFLLLHAFANGTTALTGVEAISNGVPAFKEPKSRNAGITLVAMSVILAIVFLGITYLAVTIGVVPAETPTVISQLARTVYDGGGVLYLLAISATTIILIMAANTAFAGFPRLSALVAADGYLPRQLAFRGSRLVYSRGIVALALIASLLIVVFQASVSGLIPLYAIGVFLSFTLSQAGMARRWLKIGRLRPGEEAHERGSVLHSDPRWRIKTATNGCGAVCTLIVMLVFTITKFAEGAWIIIVVVPILVAGFVAIHGHYQRLARRLSLEDYGEPARILRQRVIMPISGVHRGTLAALHYARSLSDDVTAVHVSVDPAEAAALREKWDTWGEGVRLVILESPYRLLLEPLLDYIEDISARRQPNETITIIVPRFVPRRFWNNALHTQTHFLLRQVLKYKPGIVITDVPYQVD
jgi:amino acid transporter